MSMRPSIFEVAKRAKCSIATVSNALNNKGNVSDEVRAKILRIVETIGYRVDSRARNFRTRKTDTFGLLFYPNCAEIFRNSFYAEVMEGLERRLTKTGHHLLLAGYEASTSESPVPKFLQGGTVDGLIMLGRFPGRIVQMFHKIGVPMMLLDAGANMPIDSVVSDGLAAGILSVRHLMERGHRRIMAMAYGFEDYNIDLRLEGFLAGLRECGLRQTKQSVMRGPSSHDELYLELKKRLARPNPPTAIVTSNDTMAERMIRRLTADGISVPRQLSIIGYDDDPFAATLEPALTTIRVDRKQLGLVGAELMLERVGNPKRPSQKLRLPVELIERASVATVGTSK